MNPKKWGVQVALLHRMYPGLAKREGGREGKKAASILVLYLMSNLSRHVVK